MTARIGRRIRLGGFATWQLTLAAALLALGFLVAAQIRAAAPQQQYSTQERQPLVNTVLDLQAEHASLTKEIQDIRQQIDNLRQSGQGNQSEVTALNDQLKQAQIAAGFIDLQGPGGYLYLADGTPPAGSDANPADFRVSAEDLRIVVAALWRSGAEAISINAERVVTTTAILDVGGSILINSAYVSGPYTISVIAPKDVWDQLVRVDTFRQWNQTRSGPYNLNVQYKPAGDVVVLGYAGSAGLKYGRVSPAPSIAP